MSPYAQSPYGIASASPSPSTLAGMSPYDPYDEYGGSPGALAGVARRGKKGVPVGAPGAGGYGGFSNVSPQVRKSEVFERWGVTGTTRVDAGVGGIGMGFSGGQGRLRPPGYSGVGGGAGPGTGSTATRLRDGRMAAAV